jgi:hypothetical protein
MHGHAARFDPVRKRTNAGVEPDGVGGLLWVSLIDALDVTRGATGSEQVGSCAGARFTGLKLIIRTL